jgi:hypothetical protein
MKHKPTDKEVSEYRALVNKWADQFGLQDWRIVFNDKNPKGSLADVACDVSGRVAVFRLGAIYDGQDQTPEMLACHETLHVLLAAYEAAIESKAEPTIVMSEEHRIIHTLVRLLCPKL